MQLYVYYKAPVEAGAELERRVLQMQAGLAVPASLCRRPHAQDGMLTWLEVYPAATEGFESRLKLAVLEAGLAELLHGERHAEYFVEVAPCA